MPHLRVSDFSVDLIAQDFVQAFDCGAEEWSFLVSEWIKGRPEGKGVRASLAKGTRVWLFFDDADEFVGYGSLGPSRWIDPHGGTKIDIFVIPMLGVDHRFHHHGFGRQILRHLRAKAEELRPSRAALGLFVDIRNAAAVRLYESEGFAKLDLQRGHYRMLLHLAS